MEQMSGWRIFSLRGVAVKLHFSLLLLVIYVVLIAMAQFSTVVQMSGATVEDLSGPPFIWALIFAFSLIASIFVHEFGHVLVAQAKGYPVHQVSLMMLGGVSHIEHMPEKPSDEFKIAIIGPLVSLAIGAILFGVRAVVSSANLDFFCYWIGQTNIVLGIFNLIPAFPTDGGRVLRAMLASVKGPVAGTEAAVRVSHVFALLLFLLGLLQVNFLLMILSVFIYIAAKSELLFLMARTTLKGLKVRDVTDFSVPAISDEALVSDAVQMMMKARILFLPIIGQNETYSMIGIEKVKRVPLEMRGRIAVRDIQDQVVKAIQVSDDLENAFADILRQSGSAVPVVDGHMLIGVAKSADLLKLIQLRQLSLEEKDAKPIQMGLRPAH